MHINIDRLTNFLWRIARVEMQGGEYYVRVQHESVFASRAAVDKYSCDLNTYAGILQRFWKPSISPLIFHLSFIPPKYYTLVRRVRTG